MPDGAQAQARSTDTRANTSKIHLADEAPLSLTDRASSFSIANGSVLNGAAEKIDICSITQKALSMSEDPELTAKLHRLPKALRGIVDEFRGAAPRERLELLLEYSQDLPDLPDHLAEKRDDMEQVHECQTPVFLFTEIENNQVHFHLDIPQESPTIRGYAAILADGFNGAAPEAVLNSPDDIYNLLRLNEAITPQRLRGLHALMIYMKRQVKNLAA